MVITNPRILQLEGLSIAAIAFLWEDSGCGLWGTRHSPVPDIQIAARTEGAEGAISFEGIFTGTITCSEGLCKTPYSFQPYLKNWFQEIQQYIMTVIYIFNEHVHLFFWERIL